MVATEWASQVAIAVGGKAGGKGATSIGSGPDVNKMDDGVDIALKHLEKLKIE